MSPLNRELEVSAPNVVPASFTPDPTKYQSPVSQETRNLQAKLAQGYALDRLNYLGLQLHLAPYKRDEVWRKASEVDMLEAIRIAKTARTVMLNSISKWAAGLTLEETENALSDVWNRAVQAVRAEAESKVVEVLEEIEAEPLPIQVINRPVISEDAPRSEVTPPVEERFEEIIEKKARGRPKKAV